LQTIEQNANEIRADIVAKQEHLESFKEKLRNSEYKPSFE